MGHVHEPAGPASTSDRGDGTTSRRAREPGPDPAGRAGMTPAALLALQRRAGNAMVAGLLMRAADTDTSPPEAQATPASPVLRNGDRGPEVETLQRLINRVANRGMLAVDGIFGTRTEAYVQNIQQHAGIAPADGVANAETWAWMRERTDRDVLAGASTREEFTETVGGRVYVGLSAYDYELSEQELRITVGITFDGAPPGAVLHRWINGIAGTWNRFAAYESSGDPQTSSPGDRVLPIVFQPDVGGSHHTVTVHRGAGRADQANWYMRDPDAEGTAAHEFGHMIGLEDEYQRDHGDLTAIAGDVDEGLAVPEGTDVAEVARALATALDDGDTEADRAASVEDCLDEHGLTTQGEYPRQVREEYESQSGGNLLNDIEDKLGEGASYGIIEIFTHSTGSIMGNMTDHDHPVEPRHLRRFVGYVEEGMPGDSTWEAMPR